VTGGTDLQLQQREAVVETASFFFAFKRRSKSAVPLAPPSGRPFRSDGGTNYVLDESCAPSEDEGGERFPGSGSVIINTTRTAARTKVAGPKRLGCQRGHDQTDKSEHGQEEGTDPDEHPEADPVGAASLSRVGGERNKGRGRSEHPQPDHCLVSFE